MGEDASDRDTLAYVAETAERLAGLAGQAGCANLRLTLLVAVAQARFEEQAKARTLAAPTPSRDV